LPFALCFPAPDPCFPPAGPEPFDPLERFAAAELGADEPFCTDPEDEAAGGAGVAAVEVVGTAGVDVVESGTHDSDNPNTGNFTGNDNDDNGVPAGTFTVNDNFAPPTTVTVTTHS
jgi:hypothetical protein